MVEVEEAALQRGRLALGMCAAVETALPAGAGAPRFEILAITAGTGNGWLFSAGVLRASLTLWNEAECFIDHELPRAGQRSVRDLAGVLTNPTWDEAAQGIRAELHTVGPSGPALAAVAHELLAAPAPAALAGLGFSADVVFTAEGRRVVKIVRVISVDLVVHPARGGKFIRALNQMEGMNMAGESLENGSTTAPDLYGQEAARLAEEAEKAQMVREQMCEYLLTSALSAARLPGPAMELVRKQFAGKVFETHALHAAIEDARKLVSALTAGAIIQGPRIEGMVTTGEQLQAATDDLLGAARDPKQAGLRVARLSGIRELYMLLTGDYELHGGYQAERVTLSGTPDFTGLVKNALNKVVVQKWAELGRAGFSWWEKIATVEHFNSLNSITGTLVGTVGSLPAVAEGAEYTELAVGDSPETASFTKYGGYIPLTLELIDRDETRKLAAYPRELALAGLRKVSELVAGIFTAPTAAGPTMADGGALFNNTVVTTAGGHANLLTTALSAAQWEVVCQAVYNQPQLVKNFGTYYGTGPKMAINPRYLLVPRALELTAKQILYPNWERTANITSDNLQQGALGDVVTVPEWTDATDWAAVVDPLLAPAVFVGERFGIVPEVFIAGDNQSPAVFMNDESRLKVRHFLAVWVNDFRPLHKSNI